VIDEHNSEVVGDSGRSNQNRGWSIVDKTDLRKKKKSGTSDERGRRIKLKLNYEMVMSDISSGKANVCLKMQSNEIILRLVVVEQST
jgi:hypothetical protein